MKKFYYFQNHGDDDGKNQFTICYGEPNDIDNIIVGSSDKKSFANESCNRLNKIIKQIAIDEHKNDIYGLKTEIKQHKTRIAEIKKQFK